MAIWHCMDADKNKVILPDGTTMSRRRADQMVKMYQEQPDRIGEMNIW